MKKSWRIATVSIAVTLVAVSLAGVGVYFVFFRPELSIRYKIKADIIIHLSHDGKYDVEGPHDAILGEGFTSVDQISSELDKNGHIKRDLAVIVLSKVYKHDAMKLAEIQNSFKGMGFGRVTILKARSASRGRHPLFNLFLEITGCQVRYGGDVVILE